MSRHIIRIINEMILGSRLLPPLSSTIFFIRKSFTSTFPKNIYCQADPRYVQIRPIPQTSRCRPFWNVLLTIRNPCLTPSAEFTPAMTPAKNRPPGCDRRCTPTKYGYLGATPVKSPRPIFSSTPVKI